MQAENVIHKIEQFVKDFVAKVEHEFNHKGNDPKAMHAAITAHTDTLKTQLDATGAEANTAPFVKPEPETDADTNAGVDMEDPLPKTDDEKPADE